MSKEDVKPEVIKAMTNKEIVTATHNKVGEDAGTTEVQTGIIIDGYQEVLFEEAVRVSAAMVGVEPGSMKVNIPMGKFGTLRNGRSKPKEGRTTKYTKDGKDIEIVIPNQGPWGTLSFKASGALKTAIRNEGPFVKAAGKKKIG